MMRHVITEVPFYRDRTLVPGYDVGGKTGTAQIWDPKANNGRGAWKHNLFNYSFVGYIGRQTGVPDLVVAIRIEEGTPTVAAGRPYRDAGHVLRALPADRDRRDHDTRPAARSSGPRRPTRTGDGGLCDTGVRDRRRPVDPGSGSVPGARLHGRRPGPPDRRPAARPVRPTHPRRRRRFAARRSRASCSWPCPGERTDGHAYLARRSRPGAAALIVGPPDRRCRRPR